MLDLIAIADDTALEHGGGAGHVGQPLGDQATGAGLGAAQRQAAVFQQLQHGSFQIGYIHAVDYVTQQGAQLGFHRCDERLRRLFAFRLGGDAQLALALLGVGGQRGVGHGIHLLPQQGFQLGFAHTENFQRAGQNDALAQLGQVGLRLLVKHVHALGGRPRQHEHVLAVCLKGAAGGGAPVVGEDGAAHGQHGLL